jgi:hypothetical protein
LSPIISTVRATELYNHSLAYTTAVPAFDGWEVKNIASTEQGLVAALRERLQHEFALASVTA